jgi:serine/threonine protein kinase
MGYSVAMAHRDPTDIDFTSPPFDDFRNIERLATDRSGRSTAEHARHHLFVGRDRRSSASVLIKLTSKPGLVYQANLTNEIATLTTINRELPASQCFPVMQEHGHLTDGRVYLIMSLFNELPLATAIGAERAPERLVTYLRTTIAVADALIDLHRLHIFHVDLNPMNILSSTEKGRPVIRIVDFESSYEMARHSTGTFYSPPTTQGYSAPEVSRQAPDGRSDLFSLGAVLYTMLTGYGWTWESEISTCVQADREIDPELQGILIAAVDPDPDRRYPSVQGFHDRLAAYLERIWPGRSW